MEKNGKNEIDVEEIPPLLGKVIDFIISVMIYLQSNNMNVIIIITFLHMYVIYI